MNCNRLPREIVDVPSLDIFRGSGQPSVVGGMAAGLELDYL